MDFEGSKAYLDEQDRGLLGLDESVDVMLANDVATLAWSAVDKITRNHHNIQADVSRLDLRVAQVDPVHQAKIRELAARQIELDYFRREPALRAIAYEAMLHAEEE